MPGPARSVLVVSPEYAIDPDGTYRPGGMALFSRCVVASLVGAPGLERLEAWGLLDEPAGLAVFQQNFVDSASTVGMRAFQGNRVRMGLAFARQHHRYDLVIFLHVGVARLSVLRGWKRQSFWLVGIEVRRPLAWYERLPVRRARPLLSISQFSSDEMQRFNPTLPAAAPVHLGAEPVGLWSTTSSASPPPLYVSSERRPAVLIVARMSAVERYKGHDELIAAWPTVMATCPTAELWIAGTGDDEPRLRRSAEQLPPHVSSNVHFLGRVSHERLLELYAIARVFAMPSLGEGFGLVFAEAMRFGMPCICSHDSAAEIVVDQHTGLVVNRTPAEVAAACRRFLEDDDLANRLGNAGQVRFQNEFTFEALRRRVRAAYRYG